MAKPRSALAQGDGRLADRNAGLWLQSRDASRDSGRRRAIQAGKRYTQANHHCERSHLRPTAVRLLPKLWGDEAGDAGDEFEPIEQQVSGSLRGNLSLMSSS